MTDVLLSAWHEPGVLLLTFNRPDVLNAISTEVSMRLDEQLMAAAADPGTRCIVLTGAGERAFSAGYDIHELATMDDDQHALVQLQREDWTWRLASHPVPIVAAVNGVAHGMGAIIASCADLRIAAASATFRITAAKYGGANLTWNLPLLIGWSHTKDLLLTSRMVAAEEAASMGFVNRVVPDQEVLSEALSVARSIAELPPEGVREVKRLLHEGAGAGFRARYDSEHVAMRHAFRHRPMTEVFEGFLTSRRRGGA